MLSLPILAGAVAGCVADEGNDSLHGATIEVLAFWSGGEQEAFTKVYELFERRTGVDVRYIPGGDELATILRTRIQGGNPPHVAIPPQPGLIDQLAGAGDLKPLVGAVADEVDRSYEPVWRTLGSVGDQLYAVFFKASNKSTFWYNAEVLSDNGFEPPRTWDGFISLCHQLSDLGVTPVAVGGADGWVLTDWFENVYLQVAGPELYDKLSRHEIPWTDPSVRQALVQLARLFGEDRLLDGGRTGALQTEYEASVVNVFGPQADVAMVYEGDFVAGVVQRETTAVVGEGAGQNARFFSFPSINHGPTGVVVGGDAAVALRDDRATMEFMRFLATAEAAAEWARIGGFLSPNRLVSMDDYPEGPVRTLAEQIRAAGNDIRFDMSDLYPAAFGATKGAGQWKALQDFLNNPEDIDAVMKQLEDAAIQALR